MSCTPRARALPSSLLLLCGIVAAGSTAGAATSFAGLGDLSGGGFGSLAQAISDDGSVVVGRGVSSTGFEAFAWDASNGIAGLGDLPGGITSSHAWAVSSDGSVIAGAGSSASGAEAFRWEAGAISGLGDLAGGNDFSEARAVSGDGAVVVGQSSSSAGFEAFRWDAGGGIQGLGFLGGGTSIAHATNQDGSVVVGDSGNRAFVWDAGNGMQGLGDLTGGGSASEAHGISEDAQYIVGQASSGNGPEAFLWDAANGMQGLGDLSGVDFESIAYDVSGNGRVVVGSGSAALGVRAFVWDPVNGIRSVEDVLLQLGVLVPAGWVLNHATGVSSDGRTLVGWGVNPDGFSEAWIAQVPEPTSGVLLGFGLLALARRRCRAEGR